jgi:hypothetical protein
MNNHQSLTRQENARGNHNDCIGVADPIPPDSRATFGYVNQKPSRCSSHKEKLMFLKPIRKCIGNDEEECKEIAIYGNCEPEHCEEHSRKEELCLIGSKCFICFNIELLNTYASNHIEL